MTLDDLRDQAAEEGFSDVATRLAAAELLAEKYVIEWEKVAEIVLRREKGDSHFGLATRLLPLVDSADLDAAFERLSSCAAGSTSRGSLRSSSLTTRSAAGAS